VSDPKSRVERTLCAVIPLTMSHNAISTIYTRSFYRAKDYHALGLGHL
jgi:hypothetical protein